MCRSNHRSATPLSRFEQMKNCFVALPMKQFACTLCGSLRAPKPGSRSHAATRLYLLSRERHAASAVGKPALSPKRKGEISCETSPSAVRILEDQVPAPDRNRAVPQSPGRREQARYLLVFRSPPVARASVATACLLSPKPGCPTLVARSGPRCQGPSWFDFRSLLGEFLLRWF
jgi:hypothetical protein